MTEQTDAAEVLPWAMAHAIADREVARWLAAREAAALTAAADAIEARYTVDLANLPHVSTFYNGGIQDAARFLRARAAVVAARGAGDGGEE